MAANLVIVSLVIAVQEQCQQQKNMEMQRQISGAANILAVAALRGAPLTTAASLTSNPQLLNAIADGGGGAEEFIGGGSGTTTTATIMDPRASFRFGGGGGPGSGGIIVGNGFQSRAGLMTGTNQQQQSGTEKTIFSDNKKFQKPIQNR